MNSVWLLIVVLLLALAIAGGLVYGKSRREGLKRTFGPEYDRTVAGFGDRRRAEAELEARRERRAALDIRPLETAEHDRYANEWQRVQARFVDSPADAVREADVLVIAVMRARGYPMEDFEQRAADVSVDHPELVEDYRAAHSISHRHDHNATSTEDLRLAMKHYRSLFDELLGASPGPASPPAAAPHAAPAPIAGQPSAEPAGLPHRQEERPPQGRREVT